MAYQINLKFKMPMSLRVKTTMTKRFIFYGFINTSADCNVASLIYISGYVECYES